MQTRENNNQLFAWLDLDNSMHGAQQLIQMSQGSTSISTKLIFVLTFNSLTFHKVTRRSITRCTVQVPAKTSWFSHTNDLGLWSRVCSLCVWSILYVSTVCANTTGDLYGTRQNISLRINSTYSNTQPNFWTLMQFVIQSQISFSTDCLLAPLTVNDSMIPLLYDATP